MHYKIWYQGLKYAANNYCTSKSSLKQQYATIKASLKAEITNNSCTLATSPASNDVN